jgi:hypothetical protein
VQARADRRLAAHDASDSNLVDQPDEIANQPSTTERDGVDRIFAVSSLA